MQYTIRNIPTFLDQALRERAAREGKSLNQVALELLHKALGLSEHQASNRDLSDLSGTWVADETTDVALDDQRQVDPADWK